MSSMETLPLDISWISNQARPDTSQMDEGFVWHDVEHIWCYACKQQWILENAGTPFPDSAPSRFEGLGLRETQNASYIKKASMWCIKIVDKVRSTDSRRFRQHSWFFDHATRIKFPFSVQQKCRPFLSIPCSQIFRGGNQHVNQCSHDGEDDFKVNAKYGCGTH